MPENKEHAQIAKKYLFDLRRFDEPEPVVEEDLPPVFSEEELAATRAQGFEEGKAEGHRMAVTSREQLTANALRNISESFTLLFADEAARETRYEEEAVILTLGLLKKLFPVLNEQFGQDEVRAVILNVMQRHSRKSAVTIEVCPDDTPGIEELLAGYWPDAETAPRYRVLSAPDLKPGQCRMKWEDGGAVRNAAELADNIQAALQTLLGVEEALPLENVQDAQNNAIKEGDSGESPSPVTAGTQIQPGEEQP